MTVFEYYRLSTYEEAVGILNGLHQEDGSLIASIGNIHLVLPIELEEKLRSHVKRRIGVLRTDIPDKLYLIRVFPDQEVDQKDGA